MKIAKCLSKLLYVMIFVLLIALTTGCAGTAKRASKGAMTEEGEALMANIDSKIEELMDRQKFSPAELAPAAVMPGSLKSDRPFTRLEEMIMDRLALKIRQTRDIHTLSRQNWFEFREGRPLTFRDRPLKDQAYLKNLVVYEVKVSADEILQQVKVNLLAADAEGRALPGVVTEIALDYGPLSIARRLYMAEPNTNPFPEGLEERPYTSIDRLTFSLAAELADAYRIGISADGRPASDQEVSVLLYTRSPGGAPNSLTRMLQDSLQQAIVRNRSFTCAVSERDFDGVFQQMDFYRRNKKVFEIEESRFTAGTVLLMAENFRHREGGKTGVALRAVWRVSPLETTSGDLIPTNMAGTYVSGFMARAYLSDASSGIESKSGNRPERYLNRGFE